MVKYLKKKLMNRQDKIIKILIAFTLFTLNFAYTTYARSIDIEFFNSQNEKLFVSDDIDTQIKAKISIENGQSGTYIAALAAYDDLGRLNSVSTQSISSAAGGEVSLLPVGDNIKDLNYKSFIFNNQTNLVPITDKAAELYPSDVVLINNEAQLPSGGVPVISGNILSTINYTKSNDYFKKTSDTTAKYINYSNGMFTHAAQIKNTIQPSATYNIQLLLPVITNINKDDVLFFTAYIKNISSTNESGCASMRVVFQNAAGSDLTGSLTQVFTATGQWTKLQIPFKAVADHTTAKNARLNLSFGYQPQEMIVADPMVTKFPANTDIESLPKTEYSYRGRDVDAAWRKRAERDIEAYRKGDMNINVRDEFGGPVQNADISVEMKRHFFDFGTASVNYLVIGTSTSEKYLKYNQYLRELFTKATPESTLKAPLWEERAENALRVNTIEEIKKLKEVYGITPRGHTIVWERTDMLPINVLNAINAKNGALAKLEMERHIDHIIGETYPYIKEWDLMNEPVTNSLLRDLIGTDSLGYWYQYVRQKYPDIKLYLNENSLETSVAHKLDPFIDIVKTIKQKGDVLDGIGIQNHIHGTPIAPATVLRRLDTLAQHTNNLQITEFDCVFEDEQLAADQLRDIMTAAFSHPKMNSFLMWGFWDGQHHSGNAPIFRTDWSIKPAGVVYKNLVFNEWWTDEESETDQNGSYSLRGFYGNYEIKVTVGGKTVTKTISHTPNSSPEINIEF